jgi:ribonuclease P protein component
VYPLKLVFLKDERPMDFPAQAMFVAPKRSFKKSPDRNTLKRRMRESYRLKKEELYTCLAPQNNHLVLALLYTSKKEESFEVVAQSVDQLLKKLCLKISS